MSFRTAANALFVSAFLAGQAGVALCQSDLEEPTTVTGCLSERTGKVIIGSYILEGHTAELKAHVGDELSVRGRIRTSGSKCIGENCEYAFEVATFRTMVKKNHTGVQPRLGDPRDWSTFKDKKFGIVVRHPKAFLPQDAKHCCTRSDLVNPTGIQTLQTWDISKEVYPGSNFDGGTFEVTVGTTVRSAGTCRQFDSTETGDTFSRTLGGIRYAETQTEGTAAGTSYSEYHLHTFQNGFCYEFNFEFAEYDATGIDEPCLIQWLSQRNVQQLLDALLSRVSFVAPGRVTRKPRTPTSPFPDS